MGLAVALVVPAGLSTPAGAFHTDQDDPWDPECGGLRDELLEERPCTEWAFRYDGPAGGLDLATDGALSPDESRVYVVGHTRTPGGVADGSFRGATDLVVVAVDADDGTLRWALVREGPEGGILLDATVAATPGGERLVVAGTWRWRSGTDDDVRSFAMGLEAATGEVHWEDHDLDGEPSEVHGLTISRDGSTAFLAGSKGSMLGIDPFAPVLPVPRVVAISVTDGEPRWTSVFDVGDHPGGLSSAITTDGEDLYVLVQAITDALGRVIAGASLDLEGGLRWTFVHEPGIPGDIVLGHDAVYVTGTRQVGFALDALTLALDKQAGSLLWEALWDRGRDVGSVVALGPDESTLFVGVRSEFEWVTLAYDVASGQLEWQSSFYNAGTNSQPEDMVVLPGGELVVTAGSGYHDAPVGYSNARGIDGRVLAYNGATGASAWARSYDGPGHEFDRHVTIELNRDGSRLFAIGHGWGQHELRVPLGAGYFPETYEHNDIHVVAYRIGADS